MSQSPLILGMGNMGSAIAQALARAGRDVTVWNRTADRPHVHQAVAAGAVLEADLGAAVAKNKTLVSLLLDFATLQQVLGQLPAGALAGKQLVNLTSGTPGTAEAAEEWAKGLGVAGYVDGAVMTTPDLVGGEHSFIVASGSGPPSFAETAELLGPAGTVLDFGDEVGAAARFDSAVLAAMYGMLSGGYLAMAILKGGKRRDNKIAEVVEHKLVPMLAPLVPLLSREAAALDAEAFDDDQGNPLGMMHLGVAGVAQTAREYGIDWGVAEHLEGVMRGAVDERGGAGGSSVVPWYLMKSEGE